MPSVVVDLNTINWAELLSHNQTGRGSFIGHPFQRGGQRGRGLGGVLASLFKMIPAFFTSPIGQEVFNSGKSIVTDIMAGKPIKGAVKEHGRQSVKNLTGLGRRKSIKRPVGVLKPHIQLHHLTQHVKTARRQIPKNTAARARL